MNLFCRLLGHTWIHRVDEPKIRWTTNPKSLNELDATVEGEPDFYQLCVRCAARKEWPAGKGGTSARSA